MRNSHVYHRTLDQRVEMLDDQTMKQGGRATVFRGGNVLSVHRHQTTEPMVGA